MSKCTRFVSRNLEFGDRFVRLSLFEQIDGAAKRVSRVSARFVFFVDAHTKPDKVLGFEVPEFAARAIFTAVAKVRVVSAADVAIVGVAL